MLDAKNILNSLPEAVCAYDAETEKVVYMNTPARAFLGDCAGKTRKEAMSALTLQNDMHDYEIFSDGVTAALYSTPDGMTYAIYSKEAELDGRKIIIETAVDITSAERERKELHMRLEREHIIVSCIIEMHNNKPFDETINYVLSITGKFLEAERVYLFEYNGETMSRKYMWCASDNDMTLGETHTLDAHIVDRWLEFFRNRECVLLKDIETIKDVSPEGYVFLKRFGIERLVSAPIYLGGKLFGFIGVDNFPAEKTAVGEVFFSALSDFISLMVMREYTEKSLRTASYTDTLTGIYNRNKFIGDCTAMQDCENECVGVVYMDLNGLKELNDKNGHGRGDAALKETARIISAVFGSERVYRVGGDEFVAICPGISEEDFNTLVDTLASLVDESEFNCAIGCCYSGGGTGINDIVKQADEKMYRDKKYFYRHSMQSARYRVHNDNYIAISTPERIKKLMVEERFVIWFQPRFSAVTGEFAGSEALIRFFGEDDMVISPMEFIPEMEDNDTIHLLDMYVFRHVCAYLLEWIGENKNNIKPVSLNMSHHTLRKPNIIENLMNIWSDYRVPKELIVIEVSEDQENGGISDIADVLGNLKKCGFRLAIDNFGSKYADLYLFADLKFDVLKLDGDMVYKIETDKKTQILSTSIMQICRNENIKIVAAGVENEQELQVLREIGCDEVQGYLFDKPMSCESFEEKYLM